MTIANRVGSALVACLVVALSSGPLASGNSGNQVSKEEYAVYDAVIERFYIRRSNASLIVIAKETEKTPQVQAGKGPIIGVADPADMRKALKAIADLTPAYESGNKALSKLKDHFTLSVDYVLVDKQKASNLLKKGGEQLSSFNKKYPGAQPVGIVGVSRVGFNSDSTRALVYTAHWCGSHCGDAFFVLLVKENGLWKVRYEMIASVS